MNHIRLAQLAQQQQQIQAIASSRSPQLVTYKSRDSQTGDRILEAADGGRIRASYLGVNELPARPNFIAASSLGLLSQIA